MPLGIVSNKEFESELMNSCVDKVINPERDVEPEINSNEIDDGDGDNNQPRTSIVAEVVDLPKLGRHNEVNNVPQSLRMIIGETAAVEGLGRAKELADTFGGLSQPTISTYARGEVSPNGNNKQDDDMLDYLNGRKTKITKRALNKINLALNLMDEERLKGCDAKELATISKEMSTVVKHMEPKNRDEREKVQPVQFIMYAPQVRSENHYETVVAKDNY